MKILYWLPRILGIALIIFWLVFVLLSHGLSATTLAEVAIIIILLAVLVFSWKWPGYGAIAYFTLSLIYILMTWQRFSSAVLIIVAPLVLVGLLFLISKYKSE